MILQHLGAMVRKFVKGLALVSLVGVGAVVIDIKRRRVSEYHTTKSTLEHYATIQFMSIFGRRMRKKLENDTNNVTQVQENMLMKQIQLNENTAYGIDHTFNDIKNREDFVKIHPLTRYDHYAEYIARVAKGEENVLTAEKPVILPVTSGTSGKSNMLQMVARHSSFFFTYGIATLYDIMLEHFPGMRNLQKDLKFFYMPKWRQSEGGLLIGPNSSNPKNSKAALSLYSTPAPGLEITTEPEAMYIHLLFGLKDKYVGLIEANFASLIYHAFQSLETNWPQILQDIEYGEINPDLKIDDKIRAELNALMKPDPERAQELRKEFEEGFEGLVKRVWPECHFALCVDTGAFEMYGDFLKQGACKDLPFYSPLYAASEGLIGLNLDPKAEKREYVLVPGAMFFEFIPIDQTENDQPNTLFIDQVKKDETYELVITNLSGFCRYRFGDIVKIAGFYNQCPKVEYLYRQGQFLSVRGEKTSEKAFYKALLKTTEEWSRKGFTVVEYCCAESALITEASGGKSGGSVPYYNIFIELQEDKTNPSQQLKDQLDQNLRQLTYVYESFRKKNSIGPMQINFVEPGTFKDFKQHILDTSDASSNQFKVPRVLKRMDDVKFMLDKVKQ